MHIYIYISSLNVCSGIQYNYLLSIVHMNHYVLCTSACTPMYHILSYSANLSCTSLRNFKMACIKCTVLSVKLYMIVHVCTNMYFLFCCTWLSSACKLYVLSVQLYMVEFCLYHYMYYLFRCTWLSSACKLYVLSVQLYVHG